MIYKLTDDFKYSFQQKPRALVLSSEATVAISDSTKVEVESVHLPPRTPELPVLETVVQAQEEISISESPKPSVREELMVDVGPSVQLAVTSPSQRSPALTPDFIEVRAQKYSKVSEDGIVDRKLPPIPASALRARDEVVSYVVQNQLTTTFRVNSTPANYTSRPGIILKRSILEPLTTRKPSSLPNKSIPSNPTERS